MKPKPNPNPRHHTSCSSMYWISTPPPPVTLHRQLGSDLAQDTLPPLARVLMPPTNRLSRYQSKPKPATFGSGSGRRQQHHDNPANKKHASECQRPHSLHAKQRQMIPKVAFPGYVRCRSQHTALGWTTSFLATWAVFLVLLVSSSRRTYVPAPRVWCLLICLLTLFP